MLHPSLPHLLLVGIRRRPSRAGFSSPHHRRKEAPLPSRVDQACSRPSDSWMLLEVASSRSMRVGSLLRSHVVRARRPWKGPARRASRLSHTLLLRLQPRGGLMADTHRAPQVPRRCQLPVEVGRQVVSWQRGWWRVTHLPSSAQPHRTIP
jgi:hypothetical protein